MSSPQRLPDGLVAMPPGPALAAVLAGLDPAALNGHDLVQLAAAYARMVAHYQAGLAEVLDQVAHSPAGNADSPVERVAEPSRWAPVEVAAALRWSVRRATLELRYADHLVRRLPNVHAAWAVGTIDQARTRAFVDGLAGLDDAPARTEAGWLLAAGAGEWDLPRLTSQLRRRIIAYDPPAAGRRYALRLSQRRLLTRRHPEGTADLCGVHLPPQRVAEISERVTAIARTARRQGDPRSIDQLKADVFADLLAGTGIGATQPAPVTHPVAPRSTPPQALSGRDEPTGEQLTASEQSDAGARPDPAGGDNLAVERALPSPHPGRAETCAPPVQPADQAGEESAAVPLPGPRRGIMELTAPLSMLIGLSRAPGMVAGYGPVIADIVRQIVAREPSLRWRYSIYDDLDGDGQLAFHGITHTRPSPTSPIHTVPARSRLAGPRLAGPPLAGPGSNRPKPARQSASRQNVSRQNVSRQNASRSGVVRPRSTASSPIGASPASESDPDGFSAADAAFLRARDRTCRGPQGCPVPASACELDHTIAKVDGGGSRSR